MWFRPARLNVRRGSTTKNTPGYGTDRGGLERPELAPAMVGIKVTSLELPVPFEKMQAGCCDGVGI